MVLKVVLDFREHDRHLLSPAPPPPSQAWYLEGSPCKARLGMGESPRPFREKRWAAETSGRAAVSDSPPIENGCPAGNVEAGIASRAG